MLHYVLTALFPPSTPPGPPLPPYISYSLDDDGIAIVLEWEEPFTRPEFDILYYEVNQLLVGVYESSNISRTNDTFYEYMAPSGGVAKSCGAVNFTVSAVSDLGVSSPSNVVQSGLPVGNIRCKLRPPIGNIQGYRTAYRYYGVNWDHP
jgi:hypothetical protein